MTEKQWRRLRIKGLPPLPFISPPRRKAGRSDVDSDKKTGRWLQISLAGLLAALLAGAGLTWWGGRDHLIEARVAVVLGNQVHQDGSPSPRLAARLDKSLELYRAGRCQTIIVSGGRGSNQVDEAMAMAAYLQSRGVPWRDIVLDSQGVDTWHTALFTAAYLREHRLDSVIVVSQAFHVPRSALALSAAGCPRVGRAAADYWEARDIYSMLREIPALATYWWRYRVRSGNGA